MAKPHETPCVRAQSQGRGSSNTHPPDTLPKARPRTLPCIHTRVPETGASRPVSRCQGRSPAGGCGRGRSAEPSAGDCSPARELRPATLLRAPGPDVTNSEGGTGRPDASVAARSTPVTARMACGREVTARRPCRAGPRGSAGLSSELLFSVILFCCYARPAALRATADPLATAVPGTGAGQTRLQAPAHGERSAPRPGGLTLASGKQAPHPPRSWFENNLLKHCTPPPYEGRSLTAQRCGGTAVRQDTHLHAVQKVPELGADEGAAGVRSVHVQPQALLVTCGPEGRVNPRAEAASRGVCPEAWSRP